MLEAMIVLQFAIGQTLTGALIATVLVPNVILGVFQENPADAALALLSASAGASGSRGRRRSWFWRRLA